MADRCTFCPNEARYITATGLYTCALCPLVRGLDSIRLDDVPALLNWARELLEFDATELRAPRHAAGYAIRMGTLRGIIGKKPNA